MCQQCLKNYCKKAQRRKRGRKIIRYVIHYRTNKKAQLWKIEYMKLFTKNKVLTTSFIKILLG
jgi:hypothetical protein